jgi:purine-binding chemotaxis protein CheW
VSQYLSFALGDDRYAVGIERVREIVEYREPTRIPTTPSFVRGVVNLRGTVLPVLDLGVKVGLSARTPSRYTCVIVVEIDADNERTAMGLVVDSVHDVLELGVDDIVPPPPFGAPVRLDYLHGLGKVGEAFVLVLSLDRVLSPEELAIAASLGAAARESGAAEPGSA